MTKSGGLDVENLWITSQKTCLPTLGKHSIARPLLAVLDSQIKRFPSVLRTCVRYAADGAQKRRLVAIGLFENIHHKNRLNPRGLFAAAGFEVYDPHEEHHATRRGFSKNEADEFMKNKIAVLAAEGIAHNDTHLIIGTSDEFAAATAQIALEETSNRNIIIINHYANSRQQQKKVQCLSVYGSRFKVCSLEDIPDYQNYSRTCITVDPHHTTWGGLSLAHKIVRTAILRVLLRDQAYDRYLRDGGERRHPVEDYEFKRWIHAWIDCGREKDGRTPARARADFHSFAADS